MSVTMRELRLPIAGETGIPLVWCPPGEFQMGSDGPSGASLDRPSHRVRLSLGFWIGRTPLTRRQWTDAGGPGLPLSDSPSEHADLPAEGMDWDAARAWCRELTARLQRKGALAPGQRIDLPTEAQWEFACRAGTSSTWYFGENAAELDDHAWYAANSGGRPHPVATRRPNRWGLYDLYGNLAEWCLDDLYKYRGEDEVDPCRFDQTGLVKITRGGDF